MNPGDLAFAPVLALSAPLAAIVGKRLRPAARAYLDFASALYLALALSIAMAILVPELGAFATSVALLCASLAPVLLALATFAGFAEPPSPVLAAGVLVLSLLAGIAGSATGFAALSLAPLAASACAILALAARRARRDKRSTLYAAIAAIALLAGASAMLAGGFVALALFSAVALLGIALALPLHARVAHHRARNLSLVRGKR